MTSSLRSSRKPPCASSAKARPRSASSERSWNSSNRTAATPSSAGSSRICRVNTPSVTTSMRVRLDTRLVRRTRRPIVSPTFSPSVAAMRAAAARAARRRGSMRMSRLFFAHGSSRSASGTRVVLPAPGGATSTAPECAASAERSAGSASSIGRAAREVMYASPLRGASRSAIGSVSSTIRASIQEPLLTKRLSFPSRVGEKPVAVGGAP